MNKETISDKQGIAIISMFVIGTSVIYASGLKAEMDVWISIILSLIIAFPLAMIFASFHNMYPGKNYFDICEICFGKFIGKLIVILYTWFFFHTGILVLMNVNLFINHTSLMETPLIITMICLIFLCAWTIKEGIEVLGRWAIYFRILIFVLIFILPILVINEVDFDNITPILYKGFNPVIKGAFGTFAFPFSQIVVFTVAFSNLMNKSSSFKVYSRGLIIGGISVLIASTMNILILGVEYASSSYYPSFHSTAKINVGGILQRIEVLASTGFVIGAFIKGSIYLLATCKGIKKVFRYSDYRFIVIPISLLGINLSIFLHESLMEYFYWILEIWTYYAMPFQVILPIVIWIVARIKMKRLTINKINI